MHYKFSMTLQRHGWENAAYTWDAVPFPRHITGSIYGEMVTDPIILPAHFPIRDNMIDDVADLMRQTINDRESWQEGKTFRELLESKGITSYDAAIKSMAVSITIPAPLNHANSYTLTHMIYWLLSGPKYGLWSFSSLGLNRVGTGVAALLFPNGESKLRVNPMELGDIAINSADGMAAILVNEIANAHWDIMEDTTPAYHILNDGWTNERLT